MLRVYLDQNKWVDLARAETGHAKGESFREAYSEARSAALARTASFPVSSVHISETCRIGNPKWRHDVAAVMIRVSRRDTIAAFDVLVGAEIEQALHRLSGRPAEPAEPRPFGKGLEFACGGAIGDEAETGPEDLDAALAEFAALASGDGTPEFEQSSATRHSAGIGFGNRLEDWRHRLNEGRQRFGDDGAFVTVTNALIERELLNRAMFNDVPLSAFAGLTGADWKAFFAGIPLAWCVGNLILAKQRNPVHAWHPHDLNDLKALSVASVYCDVVLAEKAWIDYLARIGADSRFGTALLKDLKFLPGLLGSPPSGVS